MNCTHLGIQIVLIYPPSLQDGPFQFIVLAILSAAGTPFALASPSSRMLARALQHGSTLGRTGRLRRCSQWRQIVFTIVKARSD